MGIIPAVVWPRFTASDSIEFFFVAKQPLSKNESKTEISFMILGLLDPSCGISFFFSLEAPNSNCC